MTFVEGDCIDAVLGDTELHGSVILRYSSVCIDDVMNFGNGLLCGDGAVGRGILPWCDHHVFMDLLGR